MNTITWKIEPGGIAGACKGLGHGMYAKSSCGRYRIYVSRRRRKGWKSYIYSYSAVDAVPGPSTPVNIPLPPPREHEFDAGSLATIYNAVQVYADRCAGELKVLT